MSYKALIEVTNENRKRSIDENTKDLADLLRQLYFLNVLDKTIGKLLTRN